MTRQEEIFNKHEIDLVSDAREIGADVDDYIKRNCAAMDEWAKFIAVGFPEWMENEGYACRSTKDDEYTWSIPLVYNTTKTTEELFTQYIQSINKQ